MLIALSIGQLILFAVMIWGVGYLWETHLNNNADRVLYHGSNVREQGPIILKTLTRYLGNDSDSYNLIELGAGMATMSYYLSRQWKWKKVEAVEIGPFIIMAGKLRFLFARPKTPVHFVKQNIFTYKIPAKSVVYCYLFSSLVTKLYKEGSLKGSLVLSLTFPIEGIEPTKVIELESWQNRLLIYDFRE
jgi:hypothetical protein